LASQQLTSSLATCAEVLQLSLGFCLFLFVSAELPWPRLCLNCCPSCGKADL